MRVVLPDEGFGLGPVVLEQGVEGADHMAVAHVPRLAAAAHHRPVEALGTHGGAGVLLGVEARLFVLGARARPPLQFAEERDDLVLAGGVDEGGRPGMRGNVATERLEARVRRIGGLEHVRIGRLQVRHDLAQRRPQTVDVEAEESDALILRQGAG